MKRRLVRLALKAALLVFAAAFLGFVVAASGLIPIKASSGHWRITAWFLQFTKNRSLATHTALMELPPLDDPALVLRGAGHYETGCRPCHGSPDLPSPRIPRAMTPAPPALPPIIVKNDAETLFYVVKHGIKFTGMPAWPAQERDDEVRAMVAFLLRLPQLDAVSYRKLVDGESDGSGAVVPLPDLHELSPPEAVVKNCARCHGVDGRGRGVGAFPKLAGQSPRYFVEALRAYARGARHSGIMEPVAVALSPREEVDLALYYANLPVGVIPARAPHASTASIERGREIASRGIPSAGVPPCADCHGPSRAPRSDAYPKLAGQYAEYISLELELFRSKRRGGSPYLPIMEHVATRLASEQIKDVAAYYGSLPLEGRAPESR